MQQVLQRLYDGTETHQKKKPYIRLKQAASDPLKAIDMAAADVQMI